MYPFPYFRAFTDYTPVIPEIYWNVYSQEERIKKLCMEYAKLIAFTDSMVDTVNEQYEIIEDMKQRFPELVNEDVITELNKMVEEGSLLPIVQEAIDTWMNERSAQVDANTQAIAVNTQAIAVNTQDIAGLTTELADVESMYVKGYDTIADMKGDVDYLTPGLICHTNGFHTANDGGAAWYVISSTGTANEMDVIACGDLFANLVISDSVTPEQLGCTNDESAIAYFNRAFEITDCVYAYGEYEIDAHIVIPSGKKLIGNCELDSNFNTSVFNMVNVQSSVIVNSYVSISGIAFNYPNQADYVFRDGATVYEPTITAQQGNGVTDVSIKECFFYKAYIAIDLASGGTSSGRIFIQDIKGCPIKCGVKISHTSDFTLIENVNFHAVHVLKREQSSPIYDQYAAYISEYATCVEFLGRVDWCQMVNVSEYNYHIGLHCYSDSTGSPNRIFGTNIFFDAACYIVKNDAGEVVLTNLAATNAQGYYAQIPLRSTREDYPIYNNGKLTINGMSLTNVWGDVVYNDGVMDISDSNIEGIGYGQHKSSIDVFRNSKVLSANNVRIATSSIPTFTYRRIFSSVGSKAITVASNIVRDYLDDSTDRFHAIGNSATDGYVHLTGIIGVQNNLLGTITFPYWIQSSEGINTNQTKPAGW
jgi:hypothetical protein